MAMAASSLSNFGGGQNVMLMRGDMGSSNSLVAMLTSCNPHVNFQGPDLTSSIECWLAILCPNSVCRDGGGELCGYFVVLVLCVE